MEINADDALIENVLMKSHIYRTPSDQDEENLSHYHSFMYF